MRLKTKLLISKHGPFLLLLLALGIHGRCYQKSSLLQADLMKQAFRWDTRGYFAYLPAWTIYRDLSFQFIEPIEQIRHGLGTEGYEFRVKQANGSVVNKCFSGSSLLILPFYAITHAVQLIENPTQADGYSAPYLDVFFSAALFYVLAGLILLYMSLMAFRISPLASSIAIGSLFMGTNLYYYSLIESGMTHAFSFFAISLLIFLITLCIQKPMNSPLLISAGLVLGLVLLIRPVNGIILVITPFLLALKPGSWKNLILILSRPLPMLLAVMAILILPAFQLVQYKLATGQFWVYSYSHETFDFFHPHFTDILFSYKKGLFMYTPLLLLSSLGTFLWKEKPGILLSWWFAFGMITWVLSSWWSWWYGGSFGLRAFVDFLPLFAFPLALLIQHSFQNFKWLIPMMLLLVVLCELNRAMIWEYRNGIIHWDSMNKELYWKSIEKLPMYFKACY